MSEEEVYSIVTNLKNSAPGYDEVTAGILKLSLPVINDPLTHLLNLFLLDRVFPSELKVANVLPLYKADDDMLFNNYRPVYLLSALSKVFERIMYNRLISFLENKFFLSKNQFGFRKQHSTYMALMVLLDKIVKALENGEFVIGIYIDFSKALIRLIIAYYLWNLNIVVSVVLHLTGLRAVWPLENNMLLIMVPLQVLKWSNVVFRKGLY